MKKNYEFFIHSACCNAHWEIAIGDGTYHILCEKCGKPLGLTISEKPPAQPRCSCPECREGKTVH